jgi:hypothetical protein
MPEGRSTEDWRMCLEAASSRVFECGNCVMASLQFLKEVELTIRPERKTPFRQSHFQPSPMNFHLNERESKKAIVGLAISGCDFPSFSTHPEIAVSEVDDCSTRALSQVTAISWMTRSTRGLKIAAEEESDVHLQNDSIAQKN